MTKCVVLGEDNQGEKKLKPIEFVLSDNGGINSGREKAGRKPSDYDNVELVCRSFNKDTHYDIMFAYDDIRLAGVIFYGWWNDGVVE